MEQNKKEIRNIPLEVRIKEGSRLVEGYALLFDTPSDGLPFTERINPSALDGVIERSNIFALLNHDSSRGILARSKNGKGTLELEVDDLGLMYSFESPKTAIGDELLEYIKRGEINESSFAFTVGEDEWKKDGENWVRTIKSFDKLYDISPVYDAAYSSTSDYTRGMDEAKKKLEEEQLRVEIEKRLEEEKRQRAENYDRLINMLNNY